MYSTNDFNSNVSNGNYYTGYTLNTIYDVGDYVTQNDIFYKHFKGPKFHRKIIKIEKNTTTYIIAHLDENIHYINIFNEDMITDKIHTNYLKLDVVELRKKKLKKLCQNLTK